MDLTNNKLENTVLRHKLEDCATICLESKFFGMSYLVRINDIYLNVIWTNNFFAVLKSILDCLSFVLFYNYETCLIICYTSI